eukprot:GHVP01063400.1.p1 GENE.GHVP01063400.1~~GHVP01063400.1.p1  ORF type:complete len:288 (+),score=62.68 GHVP01063400.1:23-886(+)
MHFDLFKKTIDELNAAALQTNFGNNLIKENLPREDLKIEELQFSGRNQTKSQRKSNIPGDSTKSERIRIYRETKGYGSTGSTTGFPVNSGYDDEIESSSIKSEIGKTQEKITEDEKSCQSQSRRQNEDEIRSQKKLIARTREALWSICIEIVSKVGDTYEIGVKKAKITDRFVWYSPVDFLCFLAWFDSSKKDDLPEGIEQDLFDEVSKRTDRDKSAIFHLPFFLDSKGNFSRTEGGTKINCICINKDNDCPLDLLHLMDQLYEKNEVKTSAEQELKSLTQKEINER